MRSAYYPLRVCPRGTSRTVYGAGERAAVTGTHDIDDIDEVWQTVPNKIAMNTCALRAILRDLLEDIREFAYD